MINAYKLRYHPATDANDIRYTVTRVDDGKAYTVKPNYGAANQLKHAIHDAFGEDTNRIEFIGELSKSERLYAVHHA